MLENILLVVLLPLLNVGDNFLPIVLALGNAGVYFAGFCLANGKCWRIFCWLMFCH